jgi:C4-dicarboxylate-specific signal transduction histidine kinase
MPFSTWRELEGPKTPGGNHVIEVTDNGTGMDNETVKKIFEPFFPTKK